MGITTIQLDAETKARLASLKANPRETYEDVVRKLMALVPVGDEEGVYREAFRVGLLQAKIEAVAGRLTTHEEVKRRLGL